MITIAHRVKTIIQYDKILVLNEGEKAEFGSPLELLKKENGVFKGMVMKHGKEAFHAMMQLAKEKGDRKQTE